ncbi:MAG: regulatory iron-sulfur-containing complex subunit RicT, partial [Ardenticatenales bacterium]
REHVCGVRFRRAGKVYWFDASPCPGVVAGQKVIVETVRGREMGAIVIAPGQVHDANIGELTPLVRPATDADLASQSSLRTKEPEALIEARVHIRRQDLPMKAVMAEYNYDGSRMTIYFTSDEMRVDFRNLVRDLARALKTRVLLRQIGPRDQAKLVGGIDRCGRELCCTSWMPEFQPISIRMAKNQGLPLNPSEISGVCGKLLCCLAFEDDQYRDMRKGLPKVGAKLISAVGRGKVIDVNVITRKITIYWETGSRVEVDAAAFEDQQDRLMKAFGSGGDVPPEFLPPDARPAAPAEHGPRRIYMDRDEENPEADEGDDDQPPAVERPAASAERPPRSGRTSSRPERPAVGRPQDAADGPGERDRGPDASGDRRPPRAPERRPSPRPDRGSRPPQRDDRAPSGPPPPGVSEPPRPRRQRRRRGGRGAGAGGGGGGDA